MFILWYMYILQTDKYLGTQYLDFKSLSGLGKFGML